MVEEGNERVIEEESGKEGIDIGKHSVWSNAGGKMAIGD